MTPITRRSFCKISALGALSIAGTSALPFAWKQAQKYLADPNVSPEPVGKFFHWSFGGVPYSNAMQAKSMDFRVWFSPVAELRESSFRQEVIAACKQLDERRQGKPIALCMSGGLDSEVLLVTLQELGIPYELYFADFWGQNRSTFQSWVRPVARRYGKDVNVVSLERESFLETATADFMDFGVEAPTYLGLMQLFRAVPADRFLLVGDGDLARTGPLFRHIAAHSSERLSRQDRPMAFSTSSVVYENWAQKHGRSGEFYFYRSTPGLVTSMLLDPRFVTNFPHSETKHALYNAFPEVAPRAKTTNWDSISAHFENRRLRMHVEKAVRSRGEELAFWRRLSGTVAPLHSIFRA